MYYSVNKQANVDSYLNNRIDVECDNYIFPQTYFSFLLHSRILNSESRILQYIMKKICIC